MPPPEIISLLSCDEGESRQESAQTKRLIRIVQQDTVRQPLIDDRDSLQHNANAKRGHREIEDVLARPHRRQQRMPLIRGVEACDTQQIATNHLGTCFDSTPLQASRSDVEITSCFLSKLRNPRAKYLFHIAIAVT